MSEPTVNNMAALPPFRPSPQDIKQPDRPKLRDILGPGLVTGASDDDPSGIATYSQAGAQFGYSLGWTLLLTYPLMCAIQMISAQIGRVTGRGLAGNMRRHYPAPLLYLVVGLLIVANVINIGADLGAMAAALRLLIPGSLLLYVAVFAIITALLEIFMRYTRYASVLRWLTLSLFAYVGTVFAVGVPWGTVARNLVLPHIEFSGSYLTVVVAVFGTTISPYLFFWQAGEEVEDEKEDPKAKPLVQAPEASAARAGPHSDSIRIVGMGFSNIIALFIMLTTAATLNAHGVTGHPDLIASRRSAAADRRPIRVRGLRARDHRHRAACLAGAGRQRRLRCRRGVALAGWAGAASRPRQGVLRHDRGGDVCRRRAQFHAARPDQGAVLERGHQRCCGRSDHGHDHAARLASEGDASIHARTLARDPGLASYGCDGGCRSRDVRDLG